MVYLDRKTEDQCGSVVVFCWLPLQPFRYQVPLPFYEEPLGCSGKNAGWQWSTLAWMDRPADRAGWQDLLNGGNARGCTVAGWCFPSFLSPFRPENRMTGDEE